jgi:hypothetical protein
MAGLLAELRSECTLSLLILMEEAHELQQKESPLERIVKKLNSVLSQPTEIASG